MRSSSLRPVYRLLTSIERRVSWLCGKGYGTATIDQEVKMIMKMLDRLPSLSVDIGGNVGEYTAELIRCAPGSEVHVFEPSTRNLNLLRTRFNGQPKVHLQQAALSDVAGRMPLFADKDGSGMASLAQRSLGHLNIQFNVIETVEVRRFEDYWKTCLGSRVLDVVKIDVEGYELKVLQGFGEAITRTQVLQFEFGGTNIDTHVFFRDLWRFFEQAEFDLYRITPLGVMRIERYNEQDEHFLIANFIAVNRRTLS